jgi:hypothetical protein
VELTTTSGGLLCQPNEMKPTQLGEPFSELFHQSPFVVDSACEPDMRDAPAMFIRWDADFNPGFAYRPDDPRTAAVRGNYERITPIISFRALMLRDGPEAPLDSASSSPFHQPPHQDAHIHYG